VGSLLYPVIPAQAEDPCADNISARSIKTESQIGVHLGRVDVSLGYREEIGGAFEETAVLIAVVMRR